MDFTDLHAADPVETKSSVQAGRQAERVCEREGGGRDGRRATLVSRVCVGV